MKVTCPPQAPTAFFGTEARLEDPLDVLGLDAATVVLKGDLYRLAFGQQPDANAHMAGMAFHSVDGILEEIFEGPTHQFGVDVHRRQFVEQFHRDLVASELRTAVAKVVYRLLEHRAHVFHL